MTDASLPSRTAATLLDMASDAATLDAEVVVQASRPLPSKLISSLARDITPPRPAQSRKCVGCCGTSTVHITVLGAAGGARRTTTLGRPTARPSSSSGAGRGV